MHIPKVALLGLAFIGAAFVGWMLHTSAGEATGARLPVQAAVSRTTSAQMSGAQNATSSPSGASLANRPVYLTIVTGDAAGNLRRPLTDVQPNRSYGSTGSPMRRASTARPIEYLAPNGQNPVPANPGYPVYPASTASEIHAPAQVQGLSVVANGDHIVIANNGAIVSVGDNTVVRGNTGDASSSGSIAMDVSGSTLTSGNSEQSGLIPPARVPGSWAPYQAGGNAYGASPQTVANGSEPGLPLPGSLLDGVATGSTGRAVGLAGYEIHSIDVAGNDNLATYDDSNLFMHRTGTLNGNTGDTDTSGLNVVDAVRSFVGSGDSGNADEPQDPPPFNGAGSGSPSASGMSSAPTMGGSSVSVADINGVSTATGADSLVVGGDGVDDQGVRIHGNRNVATYDDGNVAIGGRGKVNAQIGDSDTSGTVAMGITDSAIKAGGSFLPASQQAGAQLSDPFDGNDPDVADIGSPQPLNARLGRGPSF